MKCHDYKVTHLSIFGHSQMYRYHYFNTQLRKWLKDPAFDSLKSMEFYGFGLWNVVGCEIPASVEAFTFIDNMVMTEFDPGEMIVLHRWRPHDPEIKPVLKKFVHRQTARWRTGVYSIAGDTLAGFLQNTTSMLEQVINQDLPYNGALAAFAIPTLQYASHRHGSNDQSFEDIQGFIAATPNLVGLGFNFRPILFTELISMDLFEGQADDLAVSTSSL